MNYPSASLSRRTFIRGAGVALGLPMLEAMMPRRAVAGQDTPPRRMLAIMTTMGIMPQFFFPEKEGFDYESTPYLAQLAAYRDHITVFSGVSHPETDGGHTADLTFLTGAPHPARPTFRNTISLDQFAAARIGHHTRFPSLSSVVGINGDRNLSWTSGGVMIPGQKKASELFKQLFVQGSAREIAAQMEQLKQGRSVLDTIGERARSLQSRLGGSDREKVDQYFTAVREAEQRLQKAQEWESSPLPVVSAEPPVDIDDPADLLGKSRMMYDLARLALQTDSTRLITLKIEDDHNPTVKLDGVTHGHHSLTHHGNRPESIEQLQRIETAQFGVLKELLGELTSVKEGSGTLLDHTMVLYGTNLGSANAHSNINLPVLLAGGGFKHGQHLAFDKLNNCPLAKLYVAMLQRLGIDADSFAGSSGTIRGLEMVRR